MRFSFDQIMHMHFTALVFFFLVSGILSVEFTIKNNCPYQIWPATLTATGRPAASSTGFALPQGGTNQIDVPAGWSGRLWARTHCTDSGGHFTCLTGECGTGQIPCNGNGGKPPVSLVEWTLNGNNANKDTYDISLVDGFNVPVSVAPQGKGEDCTTLTCKANLNAACPANLQVKDSGNGGVIACKSTCTATNKPEDCCTGSFHSAEACHRSDYTNIAKQQCPQAYSFAFDDQTSTHTCPSGSGYTITFCP